MNLAEKIYLYRADDGAIIKVVRVHTGTAYARNGNVGNPTEYFRWDAYVDDRLVAVSEPTRHEAYERARLIHEGVSLTPYQRKYGSPHTRHHLAIKDEMRERAVKA